MRFQILIRFGTSPPSRSLSSSCLTFQFVHLHAGGREAGDAKFLPPPPPPPKAVCISRTSIAHALLSREREREILTHHLLFPRWGVGVAREDEEGFTLVTAVLVCMCTMSFALSSSFNRFLPL